jgi:hypothetical protein
MQLYRFAKFTGVVPLLGYGVTCLKGELNQVED